MPVPDGVVDAAEQSLLSLGCVFLQTCQWRCTVISTDSITSVMPVRPPCPAGFNRVLIPAPTKPTSRRQPPALHGQFDPAEARSEAPF